MKITRVNRTQADAILALIENRMPESINAKFELNNYDNDREHGYVLQLTYVDDMLVFDKDSVWIAFSENRNSDDTVVYCDRGYYQGITQESYDELKMFDYDDLFGVVDYIIEIMTRAVRDYKNKQQKVEVYKE